MAIPSYQTLMLPLLKRVGDGEEYRIADTIIMLAEELKLSPDERDQLLPSGKQTVFSSRVRWAKVYLSQARLLQATSWGRFRITERGQGVLKKKPIKIDLDYLKQFPEFVAFYEGAQGDGSTTLSPASDQNAGKLPDETPDEVLRATMKSLEQTLASELLIRIQAAPPPFFEELIVTLLLNMGYGGSREHAGRAVGKSGDGGIDGVIDQDPLGLDRVYVQAKRYKTDSSVPVGDIMAFAGSLGSVKANKGVFVTTSYFTKPARDFAEKHQLKIILIDGSHLAALMIHHNVGVRTSETFHLKKVDEDFFGQE